MKTNSFLMIAKITRPHGVKGELKAVPYFRADDFLVGVKRVYIDEKEYALLSSRVNGGEAILSLDGVFDRTSAELLRGKEVFALREELKNLGSDEFYISDLISLKVVDEDGKFYGVVKDILELKTDVFVLADENGKRVMFPHVIGVIDRVEGDTIFVFKQRLSEVILYED